jgi:myo-inositol-1(or 4)-monophosphatase
VSSPAAGGLIDELTSLALGAAAEAGALLHDGRPEAGSADWGLDTKSSPTDVVTAMDRAAEALLIDRLLGARPGDGLLGEEGGERAGTSGVRWVVDPLDGTVNYLYGIPAWSVAVAAEDVETRATLVGVVVMPALGETYVAGAGRGAVRRDARGEVPVAVSACTDLSLALLGTGFGYAAERRRAQARVVADLLPRVRDLRRSGAATVDLCWVAGGRLDAYFERGLQPWDHTAAGLVAREAGARVEGIDETPASDELTIAANGALFPALHAALKDLDAASDRF